MVGMVVLVAWKWPQPAALRGRCVVRGILPRQIGRACDEAQICIDRAIEARGLGASSSAGQAVGF